jgi:Spy/CpxP family protein refolding chaperone
MARRNRTLAAIAMVAVTASALAATPAQARYRRGGAAQQQNTQLQNAVAQLNLTGNQRSQISQILATASTTAASSTVGSTAIPRGKARREHNKAVVDLVMNVLTADQQTKLKSLLHAKRAGRS